MDLLESPLEEAIAFRYSAALASSAWAWLAVLFAAALTLRRMRAVGCPTKSDPQPEPLVKVPATAPEFQDPVGPTESESSARRWHVDDGGWGNTKGRFTAYFHVECDVGETEEEGYGSVSVNEDWRGDGGWCSSLDLTPFDGSVVRRWDRDGGLRRRV